MSDLIIRTFLDISTSHLDKETCRDLGRYEEVLAHKTKYGWLMYVPEEDVSLLAELDWPSDLLPIVELAQANGCAYVLFDADAGTTDLLPTFEW